jgi:hypothetical protein
VKIIAVASVRDERTILPKTTDHLFRHGINEILVTHPQGDNSLWDIGDPRVLAGTQDTPFHQDHEMTRLARMAKARHADWIIPFDADEFICTTNGMTVKEALMAVPGKIRTIYCPMLLHITMEERVMPVKPLPKVVFRPHDNITLTWGQHNLAEPGEYMVGPLIVRELQYRSWDHFLEKIERARSLHAEPHMRDVDHGSHMVRLTRMTEDELRHEWDLHLKQETIVDPIR